MLSFSGLPAPACSVAGSARCDACPQYDIIDTASMLCKCSWFEARLLYIELGMTSADYHYACG